MPDKAEIDTKRLRELAKAATPGPWEFWDKRGRPFYDKPIELGGKVVGHSNQNDYGVLVEATGIAGYKSNVAPWTVEDAAFIAALNPAVVLSLLDRIEELEKELAQNVEPTKEKATAPPGMEGILRRLAEAGWL